jgi:hypothetical protein
MLLAWSSAYVAGPPRGTTATTVSSTTFTSLYSNPRAQPRRASVAGRLAPPARPPPTRLLVWPGGLGPSPTMIQPSTGAGRHTGAHVAFAIAVGDPVVGDQADPAVPCFSRRTGEEDRLRSPLCPSLWWMTSGPSETAGPTCQFKW